MLHFKESNGHYFASGIVGEQSKWMGSRFRNVWAGVVERCKRGNSDEDCFDEGCLSQMDFNG